MSTEFLHSSGLQITRFFNGYRLSYALNFDVDNLSKNDLENIIELIALALMKNDKHP